MYRQSIITQHLKWHNYYSCYLDSEIDIKIQFFLARTI